MQRIKYIFYIQYIDYTVIYYSIYISDILQYIFLCKSKRKKLELNNLIYVAYLYLITNGIIGKIQ